MRESTVYMKLYVNSKRWSNITTPECTHQQSSPSTAEFRIWVSTYGLGGRRPVGHSGGLVAEGDGVFAVIRAWLVGGVGYAPAIAGIWGRGWAEAYPN